MKQGITCKLYKAGNKLASFTEKLAFLNTLGMRIEKYKIIIIYIVNQIYLVHLHGLHSGVKKEEMKSDTKKKQIGFGFCYSTILSESF